MNPLIQTLSLVYVSIISASATAETDISLRKDSLDASIYRGSIVFYNYCVLCHGLGADGKGRAAKLYNPPPANLVMSNKNDAYKELIVRRGGEAMGRSKFMPPWGNELTDEQVRDVIAYLHSINRYGAAKTEELR